MATTGPPFDKPMAELREAFVRARFAQEDVFGKPDIEQWIAEQRADYGSSRPWVQLIRNGRLARGMKFDVARLHEMAVPSTLKVLRDIGVDERGNVDACYALIGGLDERHADVYAVGPDLHLVVRKRRGVPYQAVAITSDTREVMRTPSPRYALRPATDADFLRAVLDLGLGPPGIWTRVRENARKFLCDALAEEISKQRAKAEADFDTAVAVSADGTKIVHADWVVVSDQAIGPTLLTVYHYGAFRAQKARRPDDNRCDRAATERLIDERGAAVWASAAGIADIARLAWDRHRQIIPIEEPSALILNCKLSGQTTRTVRIYVTSASLCPSQLSYGGVEVTV